MSDDNNKFIDEMIPYVEFADNGSGLFRFYARRTD